MTTVSIFVILKKQVYVSGLAVSKLINAHVILITGTSEGRVIRDVFGGDFERFREYCLTDPAFTFQDVLRDCLIKAKWPKGCPCKAIGSLK